MEDRSTLVLGRHCASRAAPFTGLTTMEPLCEGALRDHASRHSFAVFQRDSRSN
jgi:hypothetical protein